MTWDAYHRRKKTLSDMLAIADQRRDVTIAELLDTVPDARAAFADETEVLFELQMTWFQRLSGRIDRLLSEGSVSPEMIAVTGWVDTAADLPGACRLLDAHRDEPALRKAFAKELGYLAMSAGVPTPDLDHVSEGRRIQESARRAVAALPDEPADVARPSFIAWLRSAIAA